jgi:hypothetical protein
MARAIRQTETHCQPSVAMLYFHPWEFDPGQERLPLGRLSTLRTYVGMSRTRGRFETLITRHAFSRAIDVVEELNSSAVPLPRFAVGGRARNKGGASEG